MPVVWQSFVPPRPSSTCCARSSPVGRPLVAGVEEHRLAGQRRLAGVSALGRGHGHGGHQHRGEAAAAASAAVRVDFFIFGMGAGCGLVRGRRSPSTQVTPVTQVTFGTK